MIDIARDGRRGTGRYRKRERAYNVAAGADNSVQLKLLLAAAEVTKKTLCRAIISVIKSVYVVCCASDCNSRIHHCAGSPLHT